MNWLAITTIVLCAWAFLRVLGGERQRLIQELPVPEPTSEAAPEPATPPSPAKTAKPNPKPR